MSYRLRLFCVVAGSVMFLFGLLSGYNAVPWDPSMVELGLSALAGGAGLGLILAAFVPRD